MNVDIIEGPLAGIVRTCYRQTFMTEEDLVQFAPNTL